MYHQFQPYFNFLLDPEHNASAREAFRSTYIPNPKVEAELTRFICSPRNQILAFTGPKGSGKSTTIRYLFGETSTPSMLNVSNPDVDFADQTLIVPFFLDSYQIVDDHHDVVKTITPQILAATSFVEKRFRISVVDGDLYEFISTHKPALLHGSEIDPGSTESEVINFLRKSAPYAYAAERLKFGLSKSGITRVIILIDDIESAPYEVQRRFVKGMLNFRDCMHNTGQRSALYRVEFLFSCRPITFKLFKKDPNIDGFPVSRSVRITDPASIDELVRKRFDFAIEQLGEGRTGDADRLGIVKDRAKWNDSIRIFDSHISQYARRYGNFVAKVCNDNLREALTSVQTVLENSAWYEAPPDEGAFDVREHQYRLTEAGFFRALVLKESDVYQRKNDPILANLLMNFESPRADLMLAYLVKHLVVVERSRPMSVIPVRNLRDKMEICFPEDVVSDYFEDVVSYAEESGLVYRDSVTNKMQVMDVLLPLQKLFAQWRLLRKTSVILEFSRDDCWLSHDGRPKKGVSRKATSKLQGAEKFAATLDLIGEMMLADRNLHQQVRRRGLENNFISYFGRKCVSHILMDGLNASARRYFQNDKGRVAIPSSISKKMVETRGFLRSFEFHGAHR